MEVEEFFERYPTFQERRAFIIELVDADMNKAGLFLVTHASGAIFYDKGGSEETRRCEIYFGYNALAKNLLFFRFPLYGYQFNEIISQGVLGDQDVSAIMVLSWCQDLELLPKLIEYLSAIGCLQNGK